MNDFLGEARAFAASNAISHTQEGLILPASPERADMVIATSLDEVRSRIAAAEAEGKAVLYLPGSYDLVHLGHLSYVLQVLQFAAREAPGRSLYTVILADSDELISHVKAYKYIGNGGNEPFRRPIERKGEGRHPRLDALAAFPVDCVTSIPFVDSPALPSFEPSGITNDSLADRYNAMAGALGRNAARDELLTLWEPVVWAVATGMAINPQRDDAPEPFAAGGITRVLSRNDVRYFNEASHAMRIAGIAVADFADTVVMSTSGLLHAYGAEELLTRKALAVTSRERES